MSLTVWILFQGRSLRAQLGRVLRRPDLGDMNLCWFDSRKALESDLMKTAWDPAGTYPDLVILHQTALWDKGTDLIRRIRILHPVDYLPLKASPASSDLLRARDQGAFDLIQLPATDERLYQAMARWTRARRYLAARNELSQTSIDRYFRLLGSAAPPAPPLPMPGEAGMKILRELYGLCLQYPEGLTMREACRRMEASSYTLRRYFKLLEQMGLIQEISHLTGARGRPELIYLPYPP